MILYRLNRRVATPMRLIGLALVLLSVLNSRHHPDTSGRGLLVLVLLVAAVAAWIVWTIWPRREHGIMIEGIAVEAYVLAIAGGILVGAAPDSAASAFVFVGVAAGSYHVQLTRAAPLVALATLAVAVSILVYNGSGLGLLAYALGFAAVALAASNSRQSVQRAEQAELLLAQTQRSHEEQLRVARLEESTRIAREIHDVLAHALAGLTIQLEATTTLLEQGADRETVLARLRRAHELAREGLRETRRAVGALRGEDVSAPAAIEALVAEYRAAADAPADLTIDGDQVRLTGPTGQAVVRVVQEALTNVRKHAPGAGVSVAVHAGEGPEEDVVLLVADHPSGGETALSGTTLADTGGGYGLQGMRERAQLLGGTLSAGTAGDGWRVELRLPPPAAISLEPEASQVIVGEERSA